MLKRLSHAWRIVEQDGQNKFILQGAIQDDNREMAGRQPENRVVSDFGVEDNRAVYLAVQQNAAGRAASLYNGAGGGVKRKGGACWRAV